MTARWSAPPEPVGPRGAQHHGLQAVRRATDPQRHARTPGPARHGHDDQTRPRSSAGRSSSTTTSAPDDILAPEPERDGGESRLCRVLDHASRREIGRRPEGDGAGELGGTGPTAGSRGTTAPPRMGCTSSRRLPWPASAPGVPACPWSLALDFVNNAPPPPSGLQASGQDANVQLDLEHGGDRHDRSLRGVPLVQRHHLHALGRRDNLNTCPMTRRSRTGRPTTTR